MQGINRWLAAILALVLLYLIRAILAPFAIAILLAYIFVPGIDWLAARLRVRQVEDWFIMPVIVGRAVHLHPAMTLFAALAGGALIGPFGLLLGVPAAAAIKVILDVMQPPVEEDEKDSGEAVKQRSRKVLRKEI